MKINQKGFSTIEILIVVVIVGLVGVVGWLVFDRQKTNSKTQDNVPQPQSQPISAPEAKVEQQKDYSTFTVSPTGQLNDQGTCKSGEVIFGKIYNSENGENYEYDCQGPKEAIQYVSVVFGERTSSVVEVFSNKSEQAENVTIANGVSAKKYILSGERKGHGTSEMFPTRYVVYEVSDGKDFFYALYWTGVGFSDEDQFLKDFNEMATKNWIVK